MIIGQGSTVSAVTHYRLHSPESNPGGQHPPPSSAEIKKDIAIPLLPLWAFMACYRVNFTPFFLIFINYYYCHL